MKIKNLERLKPDRCVPFTLTDIRAENGNGKDVVLWLEHAGDRNKGWSNAIEKLGARGSTAGVDSEDAVRGRVPAFARYVIKRWDNAFAPDGKLEPYAPELGEKLMIDLLDNEGIDLVLYAIKFAVVASNFRDMLDEGAVERVGNG